MKYAILLSLVCVLHSSGFAHEANEAFFKIVQKENTVEIQAEFPWTMRNALLNFNPSLKNFSSKKDFENTFIAYLKANLILTNTQGNKLNFQKFVALENMGHSHQNIYLIIFKGNELHKITNTIMFNVFDNQVNYNTLTLNSEQTIFKTSKGLAYFVLKEKKHSKYWLFSFLLLPLIYFIITYTTKSK
ncbi:MAG: hypothetical protein COA50_06945 [Flavobacteriaceae bacterium]|nr:MAG: hypothetical protein COA50_06945 [Flavobacteriaceae bacterium]